jgi:hypothetical protein
MAEKTNGDCGIPDNQAMPFPDPTMESTSHLLVPFAGASAPECRALLPTMQLPHLRALLNRLTPDGFDDGDDHDLAMPHERALAAALGMGQRPDGTLPWAAAASPHPDRPQAWFTPSHFQVGMDQVTLQTAEQLALGDDHSRPLFNALAPFCAEDGITLTYESPTRWHAAGEPLRHLRCASLDRVSGRSVADWTPKSSASDAGAQLLKRLQSEAQMLFYTHPVNDQREAARQPIVNGFWVHGAGALDADFQAAPAPAMPQALRLAALRGDWAAWQQAWELLDNSHMQPLLARAKAGQPLTLTLCGERNAQSWHNTRPQGAIARAGQFISSWRGATPAWKHLDTL